MTEMSSYIDVMNKNSYVNNFKSPLRLLPALRLFQAPDKWLLWCNLKEIFTTGIDLFCVQQ